MMCRYGKRIGGLLGLSLSVFALQWAFLSTHHLAQNNDLQTRTVHYRFELRNTHNRVRRDVEFWTYAPVARTSFQSVTDITANEPFELTTDAVGNQRLAFTLNRLAPFETRTIQIRVTLQASDQPRAIALDDQQHYLDNARFIELTDTAIQAVATNIKASTTLDSSKNAYHWVVEHLQDTGYIRTDHGAAQALKTRRGDCTEYMYLVTALNRLNGVPTRAVGGYVYAGSAVLRPEDFHNWAEVYIDGRWRVVDPHQKRYMKNEDHYIAMRIIHDDDASPLANSHRFTFSDQQIHVSAL